MAAWSVYAQREATEHPSFKREVAVWGRSPLASRRAQQLPSERAGTLRAMSPSITGFIVGAVLAIIFFLVANALVAFAHSALVFGLIAVLIWLACTFNWGSGNFSVRR